MPLMHKESQKAFKHNVKEEMEAHPSKRAQNLAIAYATKRKAEKEHEAHGGEMHMCSGGGCEHPSHKMAEGGYASEAHAAAMSKRERAIHAFKGKMMAEGGMMTNDGYQSEKKPDVDGDLMPEAHKRAELQEHVEPMNAPDSSVEHAEMNQEGDEDEGAGGGDEIDPFVMKIMMGRAKGYSKGGQVANEDSGESSSDPDEMAKWESNEFDELGKSGGMDAQYHGSEEIGDEQEDEDRDDIVSRVMKSRSKRDRMAVSGEGSTYGRGR